MYEYECETCDAVFEKNYAYPGCTLCPECLHHDAYMTDESTEKFYALPQEIS